MHIIYIKDIVTEISFSCHSLKSEILGCFKNTFSATNVLTDTSLSPPHLQYVCLSLCLLCCWAEGALACYWQHLCGCERPRAKKPFTASLCAVKSKKSQQDENLFLENTRMWYRIKITFFPPWKMFPMFPSNWYGWMNFSVFWKPKIRYFFQHIGKCIHHYL